MFNSVSKSIKWYCELHVLKVITFSIIIVYLMPLSKLSDASIPLWNSHITLIITQATTLMNIRTNGTNFMIFNSLDENSMFCSRWFAPLMIRWICSKRGSLTNMICLFVGLFVRSGRITYSKGNAPNKLLMLISDKKIKMENFVTETCTEWQIWLSLMGHLITIRDVEKGRLISNQLVSNLYDFYCVRQGEKRRERKNVSRPFFI